MSNLGSFENETWLLDAGDAVIEKKAAAGIDTLSAKERLIYCLWVADYGMRNAGDLDGALQVYADFHREGARLASELSLTHSKELFLLPPVAFQQQYFQRFDVVCEELKLT